MSLLLIALALAGLSVLAGLWGGGAVVRYVTKASNSYHTRDIEDDMRGVTHA